MLLYLQQCCKKTFTFVFVNKRKPIVLQRLSAGVFLAFFLFVHVVKAAHQHDGVQTINKELSGHAQVSSSTDCSICDYHLTKDSYHFNEALQVKATEPVFISYSFYNTPFVTSIGSTSSGRGPPALV